MKLVKIFSNNLIYQPRLHPMRSSLSITQRKKRRKKERKKDAQNNKEPKILCKIWNIKKNNYNSLLQAESLCRSKSKLHVYFQLYSRKTVDTERNNS